MESRRRDRKTTQRGSALVEFMFSTLVWVPLLIGTAVFGLSIIRAIQASQLCRDSGHMWAYGIDFTQPQNLNLLTKLASSLNIQPTSGDGAIVLSKITLVTDSDCAAANVKVCTNDGQYVFTSIFVFGSSQYGKTKLGNPSSNYYTSGTSIQAATYLTDSSLVATQFSSLLQFPPGVPGQYAYVSEVTLKPATTFLSTDFSDKGSYARSIF